MAVTSEQLDEVMGMILTDPKLLKQVSDYAASQNASPQKTEATASPPPRYPGLSDAMNKVVNGIKMPGGYRTQK